MPSFIQDVAGFIFVILKSLFGFETAVSIVVDVVHLGLLWFQNLLFLYLLYWVGFVFHRGNVRRYKQWKAGIIPQMRVTCCVCQKKPWIYVRMRVPFACKTNPEHVYCNSCLVNYFRGCKHDPVKSPAKCKSCHGLLRSDFSL